MSTKCSEDIISASEEGNVDLVRRLIERDKYVVNTKIDLGLTPLHRAARFGHEEVVQVLLSAGMKPYLRDVKKKTPLHDAACKEESLFCLQLLHRAGCPIEVKDAHSDTPLMVACIYSNLPAVAYLLKCGASVTTKNRRGLNALAHAEYQLSWIKPRKGTDWQGQTRALKSIIYFIKDAMAVAQS